MVEMLGRRGRTEHGQLASAAPTYALGSRDSQDIGSALLGCNVDASINVSVGGINEAVRDVGFGGSGGSSGDEDVRFASEFLVDDAVLVEPLVGLRPWSSATDQVAPRPELNSTLDKSSTRNL